MFQWHRGILHIALVLSLSLVTAYPVKGEATKLPLQLVDYVSSGREACDAAVPYGLRTCLLNLDAVVAGGTPPIHFEWILSNGTKLQGSHIGLSISYGEFIYGVCLRANGPQGESVVGGHWEYGINYWSINYHSHKYASVSVWHATISSPCSLVGQMINFNGHVYCSTQCAPPPITSKWSFGDGIQLQGDAVNYSYSRPGIFSVELSATDTWGTTSSTTYPVIIVEIGQGHQN